MPKITPPMKCAKCGSEKIQRTELRLEQRYGVLGGGRSHIFDVYICEGCGYSEFFFKERTAWV